MNNDKMLSVKELELIFRNARRVSYGMKKLGNFSIKTKGGTLILNTNVLNCVGGSLLDLEISPLNGIYYIELKINHVPCKITPSFNNGIQASMKASSTINSINQLNECLRILYTTLIPSPNNIDDDYNNRLNKVTIDYYEVISLVTEGMTQDETWDFDE